MTQRSTVGSLTAVTAFVVACAVCCAGPLLAVVAGLSLTTAIGALWVPGLALVTIASVATAWWLRARSEARCAQPSGAKASRP
jgi:hypothetical protein